MCKHINRDTFRNEVFKRDNYRCVMCGRTDVKLDAHHITSRKNMPNGGYTKENGITLCDLKFGGCHWKAEQFFCGYTEWYVIKKKGEELSEFTPDKLYKKINSSYEIAYKKSERLKA